MEQQIISQFEASSASRLFPLSSRLSPGAVSSCNFSRLPVYWAGDFRSFHGVLERFQWRNLNGGSQKDASIHEQRFMDPQNV